MNIDKKSLRLYAVTDRTWLDGRQLTEDVEKALKGGATMIQLREKNLNTNDFILSAERIKKYVTNIISLLSSMTILTSRLPQTQAVFI